MGVIRDNYLRFEAVGDQNMGSFVTGLPICLQKFGEMPPQIDWQVEFVDQSNGIFGVSNFTFRFELCMKIVRFITHLSYTNFEKIYEGF